jgi:hypothetical protein
MKIIEPFTVNDAALTACNVPETDHTAWLVGTTYALGDRVRVVGTNSHLVYESLQAGNVGHTPSTSPTWWLLVGPTNRWKLFDSVVSDQCSNANSIDVTLATVGRNNSLCLLNISCATVQVKVTDALEGLIYDQTYNLTSDSGITDWYGFFFEPILRKTEILIPDLPNYSNSSIQVIAADSGNTVLIGALIVGTLKEYGYTQYGVRIGIQDYSVKTRDTFGNYTILERAFNKNAAFTLLIENSRIDELQRMLANLRATPIVYQGSDLFDSTLIYGFYKDFSITITYTTTSVVTLDIEGLT